MKKIFRATALGLIALSLVLAFTVYDASWLRLLQAFRDLGTSLVFYFKVIFFGDMTYTPTVNTLPDIDLANVIGIDLAALQRKLQLFGDAFFSSDYFRRYNLALISKLNAFSQILILLLPILLIFFLIFRSLLLFPNTRHGQKTKPLQRFQKLFTKPFRSVKSFLSGLWEYLAGSILFKVLVLLWIVNLNLAALIVGFLAFYFYFAANVSFAAFPVQLLKLLIDLLIMFSGLPFLAWALVGFFVFDRIRRSIGMNRLRHHERKNRGLLNSLPLALMFTGTMGSKKTTTLTDIVLSYNAEFRDKALALMQKHEKRYINFQWILLEKDLQARMEEGRIFNLASCRDYIRAQRAAFSEDPRPENLYNYNMIDNPLFFDDALTVSEIWDTVETYAQLYFIYVVETTYSISNYAIRFDTVKSDLGNFPLFDNDFFDRDSTFPGDGSTYSHILDFDLLRLGQTVVKNSSLRGSFEFGVVSITEISKERGNQNDTKEMSSAAANANQKNDLFNDTVKLMRHAATVDNYPFIRFLDDDQRADSLNADCRELQDLVNIAGTSELRLAMPGFVFADMIHDLIMAPLERLHLKLRHRRGDKTLTGFLLDQLLARFGNYYDRVYNRFGYYEATLEVENGRRDSGVIEYPYYLAVKKIYANRFATDAFADFFAHRAAEVGIGINDYPSYEDSKATLEELRSQHSYFIRKLDRITDDSAPTGDKNSVKDKGFFYE